MTAGKHKLDASYGEIGTCRYMCRLRAWLDEGTKEQKGELNAVDCR
jgi:hypothetical protein